MKYAFTVSCSGGYLFGLLSAMNAMAEMGMKANWEIGYAGIDTEYCKRISDAFPFEVNWHYIPELNEGSNGYADKFWLATWKTTCKVIDKYDAICHTQADHMPLCNMTSYFNAVAKSDVFVITEHFNYSASIEDLYARSTPVVDRGQCALTDQFIFARSEHKIIFENVARLMDTNLKGDMRHPVIILNNEVKEHVSFDNIIPLERHIWAYQKNINRMKLSRKGIKIITDRDVRVRGIHNRWWQKGRANSEIKNNIGKDISISRANWNLIRDYMAEYNAKRPDIMVTDYEKTVF